MNKAISKKERALQQFDNNIHLFQCPLCEQAFSLNGFSGLQCRQGHNFDLARTGYLNLLTIQRKDYYDRTLFQARRSVFTRGIYQPLIKVLAEILETYSSQSPVVVDAGCGEGSVLFQLQQLFANGVFVGIDISREGIRLAASYHTPIMWCVADLAKMPLGRGQVDVLLNILSPANYTQFKRVLKREGIVIKVIPGNNYLQEIRDRLKDIPSYDNQKVLTNTEENLKIIEKTNLSYQVPVDGQLWPELVKMTPLTSKGELRGTPPQSLTIDLEIILSTPS